MLTEDTVVAVICTDFTSAVTSVIRLIVYELEATITYAVTAGFDHGIFVIKVDIKIRTLVSSMGAATKHTGGSRSSGRLIRR